MVCNTSNDRIASEALPPAFRITAVGPASNPRNFSGMTLGSLQETFHLLVQGATSNTEAEVVHTDDCSFVTVLRPHIPHLHQRLRRGVGLSEPVVSLNKSSEHLAGHCELSLLTLK